MQQRVPRHVQELSTPEADLLPQPPGGEAVWRRAGGSSSGPVPVPVRSRGSPGQLRLPGSDLEPLPPEQRPRAPVPLLQTQRCVLVQPRLRPLRRPSPTPSSPQITRATWSWGVSVRTWRRRPPSRRSITFVPRLPTSRRCSRAPTVTRPSPPERPACTAGWRRSLDLGRATSMTAPLPSIATCGQRCSRTLATPWTASPTSPSQLTSPTPPPSPPLCHTLRPPWHPGRSRIWRSTTQLRCSEVSLSYLHRPPPALPPHWRPETGQTIQLCTTRSRGHRYDLTESSQRSPRRAPSGIHPSSTKWV